MWEMGKVQELDLEEFPSDEFHISVRFFPVTS